MVRASSAARAQAIETSTTGIGRADARRRAARADRAASGKSPRARRGAAIAHRRQDLHAARLTRSNTSRKSSARLHDRHRPGGHRQDLPCGGVRGGRARARQVKRIVLVRLRRAASASVSFRHLRRKSIRTAAALRRAVRPDGLREDGKLLERGTIELGRSPTCAGAR